MKNYVRLFIPSCWYLGYQTSPSGWSTHWNIILDLALLPPFVLRIDFGRIYHQLFEPCYQCKGDQ